ncbi:syndecan-like isoform X1 [Maniola hyperantus]|uniref:syndecan-like isoform X1 n=1 Tax=Aphantopus hyperantus TaxID=2795564 RepID=UPI001568920B|nr:syndecan isoform X1 [Maniola hyperantus]
MHLSIYVWLSCIALAGYVRATEEGAVSGVPPTEGAPHQQDDPLASDKDNLFIDDDGSGLEIDESSGSGWGPGPGPDDEDGRAGSGDAPDAPPDDEDFKPRPPKQEAEPGLDYNESDIDNDEFETQYNESESNPVPKTEPPPEPEPVDTFDVVSPRILKPSEGAPDTRGPGEEPPRPDQTDISISGEEVNPPVIDQEQSGSNIEPKSQPADNGVFIMNAKPEDRATSFFAQPGILAAVIGGAVVGLLCAILVVMFIVYRMRKKDEGSYALDEPKRSPAAASYGKGHNNREFYA